ncbi:hypothetical protein B0A55_06228 [Friedmanniomyces simplex]|uniref:Uncharacterized protein n=1 Tax=Friedmanniomyces simplex TaxID=329884 RepID=A0A4U0X2Q3_9PEZI|nr:hypothetical protein B0A55_06228 [Friedmanniomyces simplex]
MTQGHREVQKGVSLVGIIRRCQVRELTSYEVELLLSGSPDAITIKRVPVSRPWHVGLKEATASADTGTPSHSTISGKRKADAGDDDNMDYGDSSAEPQAKKRKALHSSDELMDAEELHNGGQGVGAMLAPGQGAMGCGAEWLDREQNVDAR